MAAEKKKAGDARGETKAERTRERGREWMEERTLTKKLNANTAAIRFFG